MNGYGRIGRLHVLFAGFQSGVSQREFTCKPYYHELIANAVRGMLNVRDRLLVCSVRHCRVDCRMTPGDAA
jgi:hypothetical protein